MNNTNYAFIKLTQGKVAIVDADYVDVLKKFKWRAVQAHHNWYAKADIIHYGKKITISMHRFIARTPLGMITHHINENSLDNRRDNLSNMDKKSHHIHHANNRIIKKFAATPTITVLHTVI
jgi:hypothetical protein